MKTVFIAGATGYLGHRIAKLYLSSGWHVRALVRNSEQARASGLDASEYFVGEATRPETLRGAMDGVELVISSLGITRQRDGLTYEEVDYQANVNLLEEALAAKVGHFAYIHVLNADKMPDVPLVAAKQAFADRLDNAPITSTIIAPSGFFSDMADFLNMAKSGRVWLFGTGSLRLNPIDGSDLARVVMSSIEKGRIFVPVGGPDIFTQTELAEAAFAALAQPAKITYLPDVIRKLALKILPWVTPAYVHGPAMLFLSAMGHDMVGEPYGSSHIVDHFDALVAKEQ